MTRGSDTKPVRRLMTDFYGKEWVVELHGRTIHIRPKGTRAESAKVTVTPSAVYERVLISRVILDSYPKRAGKTRRVKRGRL